MKSDHNKSQFNCTPIQIQFDFDNIEIKNFMIDANESMRKLLRALS